MKKLWPLLVVIAAGALWYLEEPAGVVPVGTELHGSVASDIEALFERRESNAQVRGAGTVLRTLSDDNEGSRHQRFILELASGHTILISHNIDLAPRIDSVQKGDRIEFFGEYEWNNKGGVVHWTHDDPQGQHAAGWLKHEGRMYQ